ncbi:uncharacterized protein LOC126936522 [Macaca thibetana thibetana]|uniref:uncharacterized protein LOC126936522 n=1 Tax=Macaca thibetana thibetana TaxID=257877 RepID=UPI0021BC5C51|nr:uncharacterized protein LOC126936522 [Macaca thibetana thibetana]
MRRWTPILTYPCYFLARCLAAHGVTFPWRSAETVRTAAQRKRHPTGGTNALQTGGAQAHPRREGKGPGGLWGSRKYPITLRGVRRVSEPDVTAPSIPPTPLPLLPSLPATSPLWPPVGLAPREGTRSTGGFARVDPRQHFLVQINKWPSGWKHRPAFPGEVTREPEPWEGTPRHSRDSGEGQQPQHRVLGHPTALTQAENLSPPPPCRDSKLFVRGAARFPCSWARYALCARARARTHTHSHTHTQVYIFFQLPLQDCQLSEISIRSLSRDWAWGYREERKRPCVCAGPARCQAIPGFCLSWFLVCALWVAALACCAGGSRLSEAPEGAQ